MTVPPLDTPTSAPPTDSAVGRAAAAPPEGKSFGDHLKRATSSDKQEAKASPDSLKSDEPAANVQLVGPAIAGDSDAPSADETSTAELRICLATDCDSESGEDHAPSEEEEVSAVTANAGGEVIAQATPMVVLQISTADEETDAKTSETGSQPVVSKMTRASRAVGHSAAMGSQEPSPSSDTASATVELPLDGKADSNAANGSAADVLPEAQLGLHEPQTVGMVAESGKKRAAAPPARMSSATSPSEGSTANAGDAPIDAPSAELPAVNTAPDADDSRPRPEPTASPDRQTETIARPFSPMLTSVAIVEPGALPASSSVATVSAAIESTGSRELTPITELSKTAESGSTSTPTASALNENLSVATRDVPAPVNELRGAGGSEPIELTRTNLGEADRVRFVQRVSRAMHTAVDRGGEVQLRLSPPELGSLTLNVIVRDGAMSAHLEAETQTARNLLIEHLPALRERLAEQNLRIDRFDVNLRDSATGSLPDRTPDQSWQQSQQRSPETGRRGGNTAAGHATTHVAAAKHIHTNDQLNVVV